MKQLTQYIQEKLHISKYKLKYKVGDIIENYKLKNKEYDLICCISEDQIEDHIPRFMIKDEIMKYTLCGDICIDCKDENDINGYENTNDWIDKFSECCSENMICAANEIRKKYGEKAYLPAIGELSKLNENINLIDKKLNKSIIGFTFDSSTQYSEDKAYYVEIGKNKVSTSYTMYTGNIIAFVKI